MTKIGSNLYRYLATLLILLFSFSAHAAKPVDLAKAKLPKFEILSGMQVNWAAEKISYNGLLVSIQNFKSKDNVDELFNRYESKWKYKGFNKVSRTRLMDKRVLGIQEPDGAYFTVQAVDTADGGSEGSLIVSPSPLDSKANLKTDFPIYPGSKIMSKIESLDSGLNAETIISMNSSSMSTNMFWLKSVLQREGWKEQDFGYPPLDRKVRQLNFQKNNQLCQITITGNNPAFEGKTAVVVNWMK